MQTVASWVMPPFGLVVRLQSFWEKLSPPSSVHLPTRTDEIRKMIIGTGRNYIYVDQVLALVDLRLCIENCNPGNIRLLPWNRSRVAQSEKCLDYRLHDRAIEVLSPAEARWFSCNLCVQTHFGAHPASWQRVPQVLSLGKARPGRDAHHSPQSSAEFVNDYKLYILTPCVSICVMWDWCFAFTMKQPWMLPSKLIPI
jgi:hypothetical protein